MRVLILGGTGMLGHKLCQTLKERFDVWVTVRGSGHEVARYGLLDPDRIIENVEASYFDSVIRAAAVARPDAIVNCIGIIKQLPSAKDPVISLSINSLFPHRLANLCRAIDARLLHVSTDCVFSGRKGMYSEGDASDAEDLYGRTKFLGEVMGPGCLTLRTSIIGRELNSATGLVEWFFGQGGNRGNRGGRVRGYRRAIYSGFTTLAMARIVARVLEKHPHLAGVYHVSSEPMDKYELLKLVNETCHLGIEIEPDDVFTCDRSLDSSRFRAMTGFVPPAWPEMIREMCDDPTPYDDWRKK